ncbi:MAG TPA: hypothetical protein VFL55_14135 [Acetobacteraceae bacterium]|nr:hypothetical protein [Acetobacteraceae bacterium]
MRYLLPHFAAGCLAGLVAAAAIVATDLGSLLALMQHSPEGWLGGVLLAFGFVVTFGSVAVGSAIQQIGQQE